LTDATEVAVPAGDLPLEHARRITLRLRSTARRSRSRVMLATIMQAIDMNPRTKTTVFPKRD
jgi:hypothetical protein